MPNDNTHVNDLVDDFLHGLLEKTAADRVETHCEACEDCAAALSAAKTRLEVLQSVPAIEAPEELIQRTVERIDRKVVGRQRFRRHFFRTLTAVTAASVLIIGGYQWHYQGMTASPYDVHLIGQNQLLSGSTASLRLAIFDRIHDSAVTATPMRLVLVDTAGDRSVVLGESKTDGQGTAQTRFDLPDWEPGTYQLKIIAETETGDEVVTRPITLSRSWKLMLTTDKPVYQPGQTIRIRSLGLRKPDSKPVAGQDAVFEVIDPKGNIVYREKSVTSAHGITSTDCALATEIIEGPYTIRCNMGGTEQAMTVDVTKYTLPKFQIGLTVDRSFYQPGQKLKGTVQADYFFGKPVAAGTVTVALSTTDVGPQGLKELELTTDATGQAEFEFVLPENLVGRQQRGGDAEIRLSVTVTDTAGQKYSIAQSRVVTNQPVKIEVIPETGTLVGGVKNKVYLFTTHADGKPAKTRIAVNGQDKEITTSQLGVGTLEITPETDTIGLTIRATDQADESLVGRRNVQLACGRAGRDFLFRTDKAVYTGGESISVVALGGGQEPVFLDFIKDDQTVLTQVIDVNAGRGEFAFDLPAELFGTLRLCAYRYGAEGLPVMKLRTIHVKSASDLKIEAALDKKEYRPGQSAKLNLTLTDADGKPMPGAISLSAVDEAVYHVLRQRPGMERTFFQLEQQLLEPVYAIYPWNPFTGPTEDLPLADRIEFKQALFSLTTQSVASPNLPNRRDDVQHRNDFRGMEPGMEPMMRGDVMMEDGAVPPTDFGQPRMVTPVAFAASPFTLSESSYAAKVQRVAEERTTGLANVKTAWWWLAGFVAVGLLAAFVIFLPRPFLIAGGLAAFGIIMMALLLPAVQSAREAARMSGAKEMAFGDAAGENAPLFALDPPATEGADMAFDAATDDDAGDGATPSDPASTVHGTTSPVRVRKWFPETLLWRPEVITDEKGHASIDIELADSITSWRLTASAVSSGGQLGSMQRPIRVFQPFFVDLNLPVALVRNDEVAVPVVVYNYLDEPQTVELELAADEWFELVDADAAEGMFQRLELKPGEVRATSYRIRAKQVGKHALQVTARGGDIADALRREIDVEPDGRMIEQVVNGSLGEPLNMELVVPPNAIPGSVKAIVKLYPSSFSQLVEGLDGIFQRPSGCFEQTSSTTYPNILALQYLRETGKSAPEVEVKARQFIHLGYQRLLGFEVNGGGFDWFGNPPANMTLTAYGLMEFTDMAKVHDVDPQLINRTRQWLLNKRRPDGMWKAEIGMLNDGLAGSVQRGKNLDLSTTAYVAWAVFGDPAMRQQGQVTLDYLLSHNPSTIESPYVLALVANAIHAIDPAGKKAKPFVDRLVALAKTDEKGKHAWWEMGQNASTNFYGSGKSGNIEVTALATQSMLKTRQHVGVAKKSLTWLVEQKDANGTWQSTQATILAMQALVLGTSSPVGGEQPRQIDIALDGNVIEAIDIPVDQAEVMQQLNLSRRITGAMHQLSIAESTDTNTGYQVIFRYHVPESDAPATGDDEPLAIELAYDRTTLSVNEMVTATAKVRNNMSTTAPMVIVDLPIPAGFRLDHTELNELQASNKIAKFQVNARSAVIYLRGLAPGATLELEYRLEATMPVKLTVPPATVYEYYDPDKRATTKPIEVKVGGKAGSGNVSRSPASLKMPGFFALCRL
jgi:hypothetical protein